MVAAESKLSNRAPMYGWYDPAHLVQTGVRVAIATIFGEFLDRRELFGNRDDASPARLDPQHDYSNDRGRRPREELWIDFVADSGDGWDPTYAVARLLARPTLELRVARPDGGAGPMATRRGEILVFGGDQVYSTASRDEYHRRLIGPFEHAARSDGAGSGLDAVDVYAIPGNHDWYDGLNSFMGLFCARRPGVQAESFGGGRRIGQRLSRQTRSYFALKLPRNWWLLGVDAQLTGYLDRGQVAFFDDMAQTLMDPGSNIILCAAMPSWAYVGLDGDADEVFRNYSYLEGVVTGTARGRGPGVRQHNLRLVLTGDSHHYTRFVEGDKGGEEPREGGVTPMAPDTRCYVTWGGGGAFLHPTHQLRDVSFRWRYASPPPVPPAAASAATSGDRERYWRRFKLRAAYPDGTRSQRLSWRVLLFGWHNPWFVLLMIVVAMGMAWTLAGTADIKGQRLPAALWNASSHGVAFRLIFDLFMTTPWLIAVCLALIAMLRYFAAARRSAIRWLVGAGHFAAYFVMFFAIFFLIARGLPLGDSAVWSPVWLVVSVAIVAGVLASVIMGLYLWISLAFFRRHWNEAFSALRIKDYKGFVRLHLDRNGTLTLYPIGLDTVPKGGEGTLEPRLIEEPLRIRP